MKRILSLALVFCILLTFAACGEKKEKVKKIGVDVEYYANLGKIPEFEYKLGDDGAAAAKAVEKSLENSTDHHDGFCNSYEGDEKTTVDVAGATFIYDNKTKKIEKIINFNTAYEFKLGTVSIEIQKALSSYGFDSETSSLTEDELALFATSSDDSTALEYKFGDRYVVFAFYENELFATMLYEAK